MDFHLSPEQELLRESARRYFADHGGRENRGQRAADARTDDWPRFAELGWLAMLVPEDIGGVGSTLEDIAILSEEMGRGLTRAAFIGGAILPTRIIDRCDSSPLRRTVLSAIAENSLRVAVAAYEPKRRYELMPVSRAILMPDGSYCLSGSKSLVAGGARADQLVVSAGIVANDGATAEPALLVIDTERAGVRRRVYPTIDEVEVADFTFDEVAVAPTELLERTDAALTILDDSLDEAILCLCAEMLGCMDQAIQLTADYLKTRKQFGRPLAEFQVLQHTVTEMSIEASSARSMVYRALAASGTPRAERRRATSGCSIKVMQAAKWVTSTAVHLHGGIGMTCEYPVGHYLRRVVVAERILGDREYHLARYLECSGLAGTPRPARGGSVNTMRR